MRAASPSGAPRCGAQELRPIIIQRYTADPIANRDRPNTGDLEITPAAFK
jgi:hypothetical protein